MLSPCLTPLCSLNLLLSVCRWITDVASWYRCFMISKYALLTPWFLRAWKIGSNLMLSKAFSQFPNAKPQWDVVLMCFFLGLVDNMEMVNHWEACSEASLFSGLVKSAVSVASGCMKTLCKWWGANWLTCRSLCLTCHPSCTARLSLHFSHAFGTWWSWRHLLKSWVRMLTMAALPSYRTPLDNALIYLDNFYVSTHRLDIFMYLDKCRQ